MASASKNDVAAAEAAEAPAAELELTLDEYCLRLSKTDKRVELIGAFHFTEKAAGKTKDTESAFAQRLAAFATKPV